MTDAVGRDAELHSLVRLLEQTRGHKGGVCLLWGNQGLGKRHLLSVARRSTQVGLTWANFRLDEAGRQAEQCKRIRACVARAPMPTIVAVTDAHNASKSAIAFLSGLIDELRDRPVLVVLIAHADRAKAGVRMAFADMVEHGAACVELDRLPIAAMRRLLRSEFAGEKPLRADAFERCIHLANGNPQYLRDLSASARRTPARLELRTVSLQLERKFEQVTPAVVEAARSAAILGDAFELRALAFVIRRSPAATERALERLCDDEILKFDDAPSAGNSYAFIEPGARWVLQRQLSPARREELCRRALSYQSTVDQPWTLRQLADYHEGANLHAKAFELLLAAGDESQSRGDIAAAIPYYARAVSRATTPELELNARLLLARALDLYGQDDFAVMEYERVIRLAAGTRPEAALIDLCCELRQTQLDSLGDAAGDLGAFEPLMRLSQEAQAVARARLWPLEESLRPGADRQADSSADESTPPVWQRRASFYGARAAMFEGRLSDAARLLRAARSLARGEQSGMGLVHTLNIASENARSLGCFAEQVTFAKEALENARPPYASWARLLLGANFATALIDAGRIDDAAVVLGQIEDEPLGSTLARMMHRAASTLVRCLGGVRVALHPGDHADLEKALSYGEQCAISYVGTAFVLAALLSDASQTAQQALRRCILRLHDSTDASMILVLAAQVGASGTVDAAGARLQNGSLHSLPFNRAVLNLFHAIRARHSRAKFDKGSLASAIHTFDELGCGYLRAIARLASGEDRSAFGLFVGKSAQVVGRSSLLTDPADGEPRLTRRQRLVASLLRNGYSNRRIAGDLGIAEGTVAIHVAAILRKFGVKSRLELVTSKTVGA